jgi:hypothetical protein
MGVACSPGTRGQPRPLSLQLPINIALGLAKFASQPLESFLFVDAGLGLDLQDSV